MAMNLDMPSFTQTTDRGPSPGIWYDAPSISALRDNPTLGWFIDDDFTLSGLFADATTGSCGQYKYFTSTSSPIAIRDAGLPGGVLTFGADGDNEAASLLSSTGSFYIQRSTAASLSTGGKLWFEARIKTSSIAATTSDIFLGLSEVFIPTATVPLTAVGALADKNLVGFHRGEGASADSGVVDTVYKADGVTAVRVGSAAVTLVADTFVKLGFVYDPVTFILTFYKNGVALSSTKTIPLAAGTDFPNDVALAPCFAVVNGATTGTSGLDWWRCIQVPLDNVT